MVAPPWTRTEAGTFKAEARLLESGTLVPPPGAPLEIVTVQVVDEEAAKLVLPHCKEVTCIGATNEMLALALVPPRVAITVAV